ncbi:MAG: GNAT family N-acetyltransferase [Pirellula sp.]|nr:GNAT family N-acetyltransferase [Pirellula sp.]
MTREQEVKLRWWRCKLTAIYFKRFRMQFDLLTQQIPEANCSSEIMLAEWGDKLTTMHAMCKWESFRREMDVNVFPCLGERDGCKRLMRDIAQKDAFVPEATWLAIGKDTNPKNLVAVGTIQGLRTNSTHGAIQNIGVIPAFRGKGIGRELIRRSLHGFQSQGCRYVTLEVTVHNLGAIKLYESIGFQKSEIVFKVGSLGL